MSPRPGRADTWARPTYELSPADHPGRQRLGDRLMAGAERGDWVVDGVAPGLPEQLVWEWLSSLEALLLPYAWGTHCGWVEA